MIDDLTVKGRQRNARRYLWEIGSGASCLAYMWR